MMKYCVFDHTMHELITVSLGHHANHIVAHTFNQQLDDADNALDNSRCWQHADRPRLVAVDAQGVLSPNIQEVHHNEEFHSTWDGAVLDTTTGSGDAHRSTTLDTVARFALRPSVLAMPGVQHDLTPLQGWFATSEYCTRAFVDELHDRVRREAEACDHAQCLVLVADDAFGVAAEQMLLYAEEELSRGMIRLALDVDAEEGVTRAMAAACYQQYASLQIVVDAVAAHRYPTALALDDMTLPQRLTGDAACFAAQWVQQVCSHDESCAAMDVAYAGRDCLTLGPRHKSSRVKYCTRRGPHGDTMTSLGLTRAAPHYTSNVAFCSTTRLHAWRPDDAAIHAEALKGAAHERCAAALEYFQGECG